MKTKFTTYQQRYDYLTGELSKAGFPAVQILGIHIALAGETNALSPGDMEFAGSKKGGIAIYQATGPRRRQFEAYAAKKGKEWYDFATQVEYLIYELKGGGNHWTSRGKSIFFAQDDPVLAASAVIVYFLRPAAAQKSRSGGKIVHFRYDEPGALSIARSRLKQLRSFSPGQRMSKLEQNPTARRPVISTQQRSAGKRALPRTTTGLDVPFTSIRPTKRPSKAPSRTSIRLGQKALVLVSGKMLKLDGYWGPRTASVARLYGLTSPTDVSAFGAQVLDTVRKSVPTIVASLSKGESSTLV